MDYSEPSVTIILEGKSIVIGDNAPQALEYMCHLVTVMGVFNTKRSSSA